MSAPAKKRRRSPTPRPRLTARQLETLRALAACRGCGAVRRDLPEGGTVVYHSEDCTAPPERGAP